MVVQTWINKEEGCRVGVEAQSPDKHGYFIGTVRPGEWGVIFGEWEKVLSEENTGMESRVENLEWLDEEIVLILQANQLSTRHLDHFQAVT